MASAFSHGIAAATITKFFPRKEQAWKIYLLAMFCAIVPDADVLTFKFGIKYADALGHRGFFHSILFCAILAFVTRMIFFYKVKFFSKKGIGLTLLFFLCAISHGLLDAMTTGGLGIGFFIPFDNERYFLPWKVIQVSPMTIKQFFGEWGIRVLKSEFQYVMLPCFLILSLKYFWDKK